MLVGSVWHHMGVRWGVTWKYWGDMGNLFFGCRDGREPGRAGPGWAGLGWSGLVWAGLGWPGWLGWLGRPDRGMAWRAGAWKMFFVAISGHWSAGKHFL